MGFSIKYQKYIAENSPAWQEKKRQYDQRFRELNNGILFCISCLCDDEPLHHHHLSYKNLGNESIEPNVDLSLLCAGCHKKQHEPEELVTDIEEFKKMVTESFGEDAWERTVRQLKVLGRI